ncbi:hypothetical protein DFP72DRAFT_841992 [Ephemerocybe angulata]|uniref:Uncharacterized protein n=1 Tax=Ephemerocybe angulata TaxID=980116 RepID=A0A8H6MAE2_9AGAR|nr:hypothetical protein DFP72DRAFT_841992 [Tulosesus angulatus]
MGGRMRRTSAGSPIRGCAGSFLTIATPGTGGRVKCVHLKLVFPVGGKPYSMRAEGALAQHSGNAAEYLGPKWASDTEYGQIPEKNAILAPGIDQEWLNGGKR